MEMGVFTHEVIVVECIEKENKKNETERVKREEYQGT
jgi:hypothetical protein